MATLGSMQPQNIIVIGAGVIGLTTALQIQEMGGYDVTIIAEILPSDPKSIRYTSHWAGAHHVSFAGGDEKQQKMDQETFKIMWGLSAPGEAAEECFLRLRQTEYYYDDSSTDHHLNVMPDFEYIPQDALVPDAVSGLAFTTLTIDSPKYLNYLLSRFLSKGGSVVRGAVQHISQVIEGGADTFTGVSQDANPPDAVVVCAGLGARTLGGVEDKDVYPIRGQTVLLRAPWVTSASTISSTYGVRTYIIPRKSGDVIIGGTRTPNDWYPSPRKETTEDILCRALALCPDLAPPEIRAHREPTVDDLRPIIIEEGCGLRPARVRGTRLEVDLFEGMKGGRKVSVVYNYGHGGFGFQSSWGSASMAYELLKEALATTQ